VVHTEQCVCVPHSVVLAKVRSDMRYTLKCVCVCVPYSVVLATVRSDMRYKLTCVCVCAVQSCVSNGTE